MCPYKSVHFVIFKLLNVFFVYFRDLGKDSVTILDSLNYIKGNGFFHPSQILFFCVWLRRFCVVIRFFMPSTMANGLRLWRIPFSVSSISEYWVVESIYNPMNFTVTLYSRCETSLALVLMVIKFNVFHRKELMVGIHWNIVVCVWTLLYVCTCMLFLLFTNE